jgi:hypothetical protein
MQRTSTMLVKKHDRAKIYILPAFISVNIYCALVNINYTLGLLPGDQKGLFKLAVQLRKFYISVIYNTATGYVLLVYLTNI